MPFSKFYPANFYDMIFPQYCPYCGELTGEICEFCEECSSKMSNMIPHEQILRNGVKTISAFEYSGKLKYAVINYKYNKCRQFYKPFVLTYERLIKECLSNESFDCYTYVPPYKFDFLYRFDHTKLLAKSTAELMNIPCEKLLTKSKKKQTQHILRKNERMVNVQDLYHCSDLSAKGKRILLFDDIVTTGATLIKCSDLLIKNGAEKVVCITLFQTPLK